jgi:SAM-dependent methyltransferase
VDSDEWARRASSFGAVAASYAQYRPEYRADAARWCVAPVGRDIGSLRVLDLGAGTGKLTKLLVDLGADVTAVEPDDAMRAELGHGLPTVRALPGSAEQIPLPDAAVDAVLAAQAMHWFDLPRALPEIARVLVPGGVLGALWNDEDDQVPWVAGLQRAAADAASPSVTQRRAGLEYFSPARFATAQGGRPRFSAPERTEFANGQRLTADALLRQVGTHSHVLLMEPTRRERRLAEIRAYLATTPETAAGEFELPMITSVQRAVRLG